VPVLRKKLPAAPFPVPASWLPATTPDANARVTRRALAYCGILEVPAASNRGVEIDRWLRWANVPESLITAGRGWWCAAFVGGVLREEGLAAPLDYASTDAWIPYLAPGHVAEAGDIVLYGLKKNGKPDAHHIGLVVRRTPQMLTVEGNRAFAGTSNNGVAVDVGPMQRTDVLGYIPLAKFM